MQSKQGHRKMLKESDSLSLVYTRIPVFTQRICSGICSHHRRSAIYATPSMGEGTKAGRFQGGCMRAASWNREGIGRPHLPFSFFVVPCPYNHAKEDGTGAEQVSKL